MLFISSLTNKAKVLRKVHMEVTGLLIVLPYHNFASKANNQNYRNTEVHHPMPLDESDIR